MRVGQKYYTGGSGRGRVILVALAVLVLVACGGETAPGVLTADSVVAQFKAAGLPIESVKPGIRPAKSTLPNSYKEYDVLTTNGKDAGLFVCDTKANCDALYAYFDALKALAGPYLYQSKDGLVVLQMNSGLAPDHAAKFGEVVKGL